MRGSYHVHGSVGVSDGHGLRFALHRMVFCKSSSSLFLSLDSHDWFFLLVVALTQSLHSTGSDSGGQRR